MGKGVGPKRCFLFVFVGLCGVQTRAFTFERSAVFGGPVLDADRGSKSGCQRESCHGKSELNLFLYQYVCLCLTMKRKCQMNGKHDKRHVACTSVCLCLRACVCVLVSVCTRVRVPACMRVFVCGNERKCQMNDGHGKRGLSVYVCAFMHECVHAYKCVSVRERRKIELTV